MNPEFKIEQVIGWAGIDTFHLYRNAVENFDDCAFAEVGTFFGRSIIFLAQEIHRQGKNIKVYAIDTFRGRAEDPHNHLYQPTLDTRGGDIYGEFLQNVKDAGVEDIVTPLRGVSWEMAASIPDDSLSMVFIDAGHSYEDCKRDIDAFWPKLKVGGWMTGDDYNHRFPGVVKAVDHLHRECWWWGSEPYPELLIRNRMWKIVKLNPDKEEIDMDAPAGDLFGVGRLD
jgi:predicted O-methyltransferase YrrM